MKSIQDLIRLIYPMLEQAHQIDARFSIDKIELNEFLKIANSLDAIKEFSKDKNLFVNVEIPSPYCLFGLLCLASKFGCKIEIYCENQTNFAVNSILVDSFNNVSNSNGFGDLITYKFNYKIEKPTFCAKYQNELWLGFDNISMVPVSQLKFN